MPQSQNKVFDYAVIGAGPAAICAIPALVAKGVSLNQLIWIDAGGFQVGAFGSSLSEGSSVPGNTSVASYKNVNNAIYKILPECKPQHKVLFDDLADDQTCSLSVAAEPMQHISNYLRLKVVSLAGRVTNIDELADKLDLSIKISGDNNLHLITTKKCILCIGAEAKTFQFSSINGSLNLQQKISIIDDPNIVFIRTKLEEYLKAHPFIEQVAVVGSSHSAALAVMNLLNAGVKVKQFMTKPYKFAETCLDVFGNQYVKHDNTGLKGEVAAFTKNFLLHGTNKKFAELYQVFVNADKKVGEQVLIYNLHDCQAMVSAIGYEAANTLRINDKPLDHFDYDYRTGGLNDVENIFGFGIAYPLQVTAPDGEVEFAVGYGKFWSAMNNVKVMNNWLRNIELRNQLLMEN